MRLRKYLRDRRLTRIAQVGFDRVVVCEFGEDFHLYFEFYAGGNVILTDALHKVLLVLRTVEKEGHGVALNSFYRPEFEDLQVKDDLLDSLKNKVGSSTKNTLKTLLASFSPAMLQKVALTKTIDDPQALYDACRGFVSQIKSLLDALTRLPDIFLKTMAC